MSMVGFPLLLIPLAIYNIIVFLMPGVSLAEPLFKLTLMSGTDWPVNLSDMLLALGLLLLLMEVVKGAKPGAKYLTDHALSLIVFGAAAAEFLLWPRFGTSTYFLLALLSLVDFLSGVALRARRFVKVEYAPVVSKRRSKKSDPEPAPEPRVDPVMPVPAATAVAESVLSEKAEPQLSSPSPAVESATVPPAITVSPAPHERSPAVHEPSEVVSPGLQPAENIVSPDKPASP